MKNTVKNLLPFLSWKISGSDLRADFIAGLTVSLVLIPQSMAYAQLAGLPVIVGLYASFLPTIFGALWGSSHHLQTGPVAMTSLLTATALLPLAVPETTEYVAMAALLAVLLGVIRLMIGFFKLTVVANFLSKPVMDGFIHAGVLVIASSQISSLFGLKLQRTDWYLRDLWQLLTELPKTNLICLALSVGSILLLVLLKRFAPKVPVALFVVVVTTALVCFLGLSDGLRFKHPVHIVGEIPRGLPSLKGVHLKLSALLEMIPGALAITFIGFMEMCGVAKAVAAKSKQSLNLDQEMMGQGVASLVSGFSGGYPVSGSFSRTALNYAAGGKTGLSAVFAGSFVALFLLLLAETLYYLPKAALGAIIIVAVLKLLNFRQLFSYWKISRREGFAAIFTFVATLYFAPQLQNGILAGAALAIFFHLFKAMRPDVCMLTRYADGTWREAPADESGIDPLFPVLRFDGRLFFVNTSYFETAVLNVQEKYSQARYITIDASGINGVDATGVDVLGELTQEIRSNGVHLLFCGIKPAVRRVLSQSGVLRLIGEDHCFFKLDDAKTLVQSQS
jgi:SulP family sulfate permease